MAIDFPGSPAYGDLFTVGTRSWVWDGYRWNTAAQSPSGLVLVATGTFSAISSRSVDGCFTSEFDDYRVILKGSCSNTTAGIYLRWRAAGVDNSAAGTYGYAMGYTNNSVAGRLYGTDNDTYAVFGWAGNTFFSATNDVTSPALAAYTGFHGTSVSEYSGTNTTTMWHGGTHDVAAAFDGFTFYPDAGTMTGSYAIYGYRKAL